MWPFGVSAASLSTYSSARPVAVGRLPECRMRKLQCTGKRSPEWKNRVWSPAYFSRLWTNHFRARLYDRIVPIPLLLVVSGHCPSRWISAPWASKPPVKRMQIKVNTRMTSRVKMTQKCFQTWFLRKRIEIYFRYYLAIHDFSRWLR